MPIDVVVGGQFGSEGKGKTALHLRRTRDYAFAVRPGGTNSGHTGHDASGRRIVLRQLPAAAIDGDVDVVLPAGSYVDPAILLREMRLVGLAPERVRIDRRAQVIRPEHLAAEAGDGLIQSIGSTGSGTGAAVLSRIARFSGNAIRGTTAEEDPGLAPMVADVGELLSDALGRGRSVLVEGTQGFGLSVLHGDSWPKATARDTTASAFLSEAGLPPRQVRDVVLVLRARPIRVAGDSGPLAGEMTWEDVRQEAGADRILEEYTSVTNRLRRVGRFDPAVVRRAIAANDPSMVVLNHLDHIDAAVRDGEDLTGGARDFVRSVEAGIGRTVDLIGTGPETLIARRSTALRHA